MHGIYINLERRRDRRFTFEKQPFPFTVERFSALMGRSGEDGCTWSHLAVLSKQNEFPFAVFEDDCILIEPWDIVEKAMTQLPPNWDALWLGANLTHKLDRYSENLFRLRKAYCLHAVIYNTKRMVDFILLNHKTPQGKNLDLFYFDKVFDHFNCFITYPMVATQSNSVSNICNRYVEYGTTELLASYKKYTI